MRAATSYCECKACWVGGLNCGWQIQRAGAGRPRTSRASAAVAGRLLGHSLVCRLPCSPPLPTLCPTAVLECAATVQTECAATVQTECAATVQTECAATVQTECAATVQTGKGLLQIAQACPLVMTSFCLRVCSGVQLLLGGRARLGFKDRCVRKVQGGCLGPSRVCKADS